MLTSVKTLYDGGSINKITCTKATCDMLVYISNHYGVLLKNEQS